MVYQPLDAQQPPGPCQGDVQSALPQLQPGVPVPLAVDEAEEAERKTIDLSYSLGLKVKEDGLVIDIAYAGPAQKAGIAPAVTIVAVNNRQFTPTVLREAVQATASGTKPLELLIKTGEYYETHRIDYHGGERYPHLVRDPEVPDLLSEIIKPLAKH